MTKTLINLTAAALTLSAAGAIAAPSYYAFTAGNPDITSDRSALRDITPGQPSVSAGLDRYQGIATGNGDLSFDVTEAMSRSHELPGIYGGFGGYPDAQF
jgi:hypothetical protein